MHQDSLQKEFYPVFFAEQWNRKFNQILTETFLFSNENLNSVEIDLKWRWFYKGDVSCKAFGSKWRRPRN